MISTRIHGLIDYSVASLFGSLAVGSDLPAPVRSVLGAAGGFHAAYSALTDYEAGLQPQITMRQHLMLDALGAVALGGAGLLMRGQPRQVRTMMVGAAIAELAIVALSSARPESGPGQGAGPVDRMLGPRALDVEATYLPVDTPKRVADGVFVVDSVMPAFVGLELPVRMTVIHLPNGDLLLHSPTRYSGQLRRELEAIGPIRHLVAPNSAHWMFVKDWQDACLGATTWAAPGLRQRWNVRRSGVRLDRDLWEGAPAEWEGAVKLATVPGGLGFREVTLFHRPSATLVLTDLVVNLEEAKLPVLFRPIVRLFGSTAPDGMPPPYLRAIIKLRREDAHDTAAALLALQPERVIFAHGQWFERDGTARLRQSLRWLVG